MAVYYFISPILIILEPHLLQHRLDLPIGHEQFPNQSAAVILDHHDDGRIILTIP
jgi:hypothetical protein